MIPNVTFEKQDGQTGVVRDEGERVTVIIAPTISGPSALTPATSQDLIEDEYGECLLTENAAYQLGAGVPVILIGVTDPSEPAESSDFEPDGTGSAVLSAGSTDPVDDFDIVIRFIEGGTVGIAGITYRVSFFGGVTGTFGPITKLGTTTSLELLDQADRETGVTIEFGAGDIADGDEWSFTTKAAYMNTGDLTEQLEKLQQSDLDYEQIHVVGLEADDTTVTLLDEWLEERETEGIFSHFVVSTRLKGPSESEAAFLAELDIMSDDISSIRGGICADGGDIVSVIRGFRVARQTSWALARRLSSTGVAIDAAQVDLGPLDGVKITDAKGNAKYHNEAKSPGLDDLRFTTLRTMPRRDGVFINNPRAASPSGSDYVFMQHVRTMNKACRRAWFILSGQLSQGFLKDPQTGFISEADASRFETLVNDDLDNNLEKTREVSAARCTLSRTDPITSNEGAEITASIELVGLGYVKKFTVKTRYVSRIGG